MTIHILGHHRPRPSKAATSADRRMLVTVTVLGSVGPFRFVAGEEEPVAAIIGTTLRCYAREGRFPALGCDADGYHLFCAQSDYMDPLDASEPIGARGGRNFVLCKKRLQLSALRVPRMATGTAAVITAQQHPHAAVGKKGAKGNSGGMWTACLS